MRERSAQREARGGIAVELEELDADQLFAEADLDRHAPAERAQVHGVDAQREAPAAGIEGEAAQALPEAPAERVHRPGSARLERSGDELLGPARGDVDAERELRGRVVPDRGPE